MQAMYKYKLDSIAKTIEMPKGAEFLSVAFQRNQLCLWAKVCTDAKLELRHFEIFGTGQKMPDLTIRHFIGVARSPTGAVFHVFEKSQL